MKVLSINNRHSPNAVDSFSTEIYFSRCVKLVLFCFGFLGVWVWFCFSKWPSADFLIKWWARLWLLHENIMWNSVKWLTVVKTFTASAICIKHFPYHIKETVSFFSVCSSQIRTDCFSSSRFFLLFLCFLVLFSYSTPHLRCSQIILLFSMSQSFSEINIWAAVNSQSEHGSFLLKSTGQKQVYKCFSQGEWTTTTEQVSISVLRENVSVLGFLWDSWLVSNAKRFQAFTSSYEKVWSFLASF